MNGAARAPRAPRRVLVVDDDEDFADSLRILLELEGYEVRAAGDRAAALAALEGYAAEVALVDLRIGAEDGIEIIRAMRARRPDLACVVVTAHASADTAIDALQEGVNDYLRKPFRPAEVVAVVERGLRWVDLEREKARAVAALRASEARFRDFAETAADWFWELDEHQRFVYVSGRYRTLTGMAPEEVLGCTPVELSVRRGQDPSALAPLLERIAAREPFEGFVLEAIHPGGRTAVHSLSGRPVHDEAGRFRGYRGTGRDITEEHARSRELVFQAAHDPLTGLVNRRELEQRLERAFATARQTGSGHALLYLDLDRFKEVNDGAGHLAGDALLRQLAAALADEVRSRDTIARLGGDEFGVLLEHCSIGQARGVALNLRRAVEDHRFVWEGRSFRLGVSIGVVAITAATRGVADVLQAADRACYEAKAAGRNRIRVHDDPVESADGEESESRWLGRVDEVLAEGRLAVCRRRVAALAAGAAGGASLALRVVGDDGRHLPPGPFLRAARRLGAIGRVERWLVEHAPRWLAARERWLEGECFVPVSSRAAGDPDLRAWALRRLDEAGVSPRGLCVVLPEAAAMADPGATAAFLGDLSQRGFHVAVSRFGAGAIAFAALKRLPLDFVKIDRGLVAGAVADPVDRAALRAVSALAADLGVRTVATGVDSPAALAAVREAGVDLAEGEAIHRPEPVPVAGPADPGGGSSSRPAPA